MNWCEKVSDPLPKRPRPEAEFHFDETAVLRLLLNERAKGQFVSMEESRAETKGMLARKRRELGG